MKIAFLTTKHLLSGGGGIEKVTREVGRRLVERGHQVLVYSTHGSGEHPKLWQGMDICWLPRLHPHWTEKLGGSIASAILARYRDPSVDIYHLHSVAAGAMGFLLKSKAPCVLQMHGIEWQRSRWGRVAKRVLYQLEKASFASASVITAVSKDQCDYYAQIFGRTVEFVPTGTSAPLAGDESLLSKHRLHSGRYILTAVRQVREKGLHYLIPAFLQIQCDWDLVIAGGEGGDRQYCQQLREMAGDSPKIHFVGHVQEPLLSTLYAFCGAYVQASEVEGMAVSLLDAMGYGKCCVVSNIPENLDATGATALSFESGNVASLVQALQKVTIDSAMCARLGSLAQERALSLFSWDSATSKLEALYAQLLTKKTK